MSHYDLHTFEGEPYSAEAKVFPGDGEANVTDLRVRFHPACRLSDEIIADHTIGDSGWTEYASTQDATVFTVEQDGPEAATHAQRAQYALGTVKSIVELLNRINNCAQNDF